MVNFKETLVKLHKTFPEWDLDTLIKIIECISDNSSNIIYPNRCLDNFVYNTK